MSNEPGGFALPMMRGFACPVTTPMMGANAGPKQGIGCGWQNVNGMGPQFFITVHAEGGFAMVACLDYARYRRFAENFASIGKQAMLTGDLDQVAPGDPLEALEVAHKAMGRARDVFLTYAENHDAKKTADASVKADRNRRRAAELDEALSVVAKALMLEE